MTAFREGRRWAWWALLGVNAFAYAGPIVYDQVTGAIGPFEIIEWVALGAVSAMLAATFSVTTSSRELLATER